MKKRQKTRLIWHRRDLRLSDNELYDYADGPIVSCYIIPHQQQNDFHLRSTTAQQQQPAGGSLSIIHGPHYCRVLMDALTELRSNLQSSLGSNLLIRRGPPHEILVQLCHELDVDQVAWSEEPGYYEQQASERVKEALLSLNNKKKQNPIRIHTTCSYTLFHPDDLPREEHVWMALARPKERRRKTNKKRQSQEPPIATAIDQTADDSSSHSMVDTSRKRWTGMPRIMGDFRRAARSHAKVRKPIRRIGELPPEHQMIQTTTIHQKILDWGELPTLDELLPVKLVRGSHHSLLGLPLSVTEELLRAARHRPSVGGETPARACLQRFVASGAAAEADRSLADVADNDQSSRLSVYLATGALSPRQVYAQAQQYEVQWLMSHMEMRDFFIYEAFRSGSDMFRLRGPHAGPPVLQQEPNASRSAEKKMEWKFDPHVFERWATGQTGLPLVDAGMRELIQTGYCSNRVRQNMASVLAKDLHVDWRVGAAWYQICLEDHCVAANYGNWAYFAGVGADPKNRHFRTVSQALKYDPHGTYVKKWIPALAHVQDPEVLLRPWDFLDNWGECLVDPSTQYTWQDRERLQERGRLT